MAHRHKKHDKVGGAMDADHIYYNLTCSNYTDAVTAPPEYNPTLLYDVSNNRYVSYNGLYYQVTTNPKNPPPNPTTGINYWTQIPYNPIYPQWNSQVYPYNFKVNKNLLIFCPVNCI